MKCAEETMIEGWDIEGQLEVSGPSIEGEGARD